MKIELRKSPVGFCTLLIPTVQFALWPTKKSSAKKQLIEYAVKKLKEECKKAKFL